MWRPHASFGFAAALLVLSFAASTSAQEEEPDASHDDEARGLFMAGVSAYEAGRYEDALRHFQAAYDASHRPGLLYNIGQSADRLREDERALDAFEEYVRLEPNGDRVEAVRARIEALRAAIARRGGSGSGGVGPDLVGPAAVLGVAGAGLVLYAVAGGLALAENDRVSGECGAASTGTCTDAQLADLRTLTVVADAGWITAAAAGAAGVVWLAVALASDGGGDGETAIIAPYVGDDGAGLVLAGRLGP